jgi:hypothetical protein
MCACVCSSLVHLYIEARTYRRVRTHSCIDVMVSECVRHALANEVRLSVYSAQYIGQDNLRFRGFETFLYQVYFENSIKRFK